MLAPADPNFSRSLKKQFFHRKPTRTRFCEVCVGCDTGQGAIESPSPWLRARSSWCAARPQRRQGRSGGTELHSATALSCTQPVRRSAHTPGHCHVPVQHRACGTPPLHCHSPPSWLWLLKRLTSPDPLLTSWVPSGPPALLK